MSYNEGHCVRSRQPTLPPFSNRTLHHPSLMPLYMAAHPHAVCNNHRVHPALPAELFYTDPTMSCGSRIPNKVSQLRVFNCFQLNTPPPVMSACLAPPTRPDPFRSGPHPTGDLGSLTLKINTLHHPVQSGRVILQLTQEEDQAITNLLKLHHQEPKHRDETLTALQMDFSSVDLNPFPFLSHPEPMESTSAEEVGPYRPFCSDVQHPRGVSLQGQLQRGRYWSDTELEAANTLLSRFSLMEEDKIRGHNHKNSAATLPDPLGKEAKSGSSISGGFSEVKERTLSDSEGDAVHVLLSLGDTGALDIVQRLS